MTLMSRVSQGFPEYVVVWPFLLDSKNAIFKKIREGILAQYI